MSAWDLPSSRTPVPVGWGDHESTELDRLARRLSHERTKQVTLGMPEGQKGTRKAKTVKPRRLVCGEWVISFRFDGERHSGRFDTAEEATTWRDQIMKERKNGNTDD
ncbi:hypothetical protein [Nocardioides humi]|uniref:AP2/ERF domain-containing protein n=1 Tax=Nocardioides humi TaxID=449461 RepID=A0ABN2BLV4_9ACTN|nr:hypothetical protein [Nocardioides humi]